MPNEDPILAAMETDRARLVLRRKRLERQLSIDPTLIRRVEDLERQEADLAKLIAARKEKLNV